MSKLDDIKGPIAGHLAEFDAFFRVSMQSRVALLDRITRYIVRRKGKQMRPMFVFFSAGLCGEINQTTYRAASLIELLHTASLIHDDVVDDAYERRGFFSLNALWKNKIAVLVGDYLLSRGLLLAVDHGEFDLLRIVSEATREMSEGELLQIEKSRSLDITEETYFEIIRKKTASLIASCCASGARSSSEDENLVKKMHAFGELAGMAFQIKDDLLDFSESQVTGKPKGGDIKEKKMTLPLIHLLNQSSPGERKRLIRMIRYHNRDRAAVREIVNLVHTQGGILYAQQKMEEYRNRALLLLRDFPEGPNRRGLEELVIYTTERKH
ncbi:MAG TPA: polyprenyl synthetase family protein [Bacteroidales bacterium]|nr:polyprenyl synthetase family protein [Bacteroidales bacterium]